MAVTALQTADAKITELYTQAIGDLTLLVTDNSDDNLNFNKYDLSASNIGPQPQRAKVFYLRAVANVRLLKLMDQTSVRQSLPQYQVAKSDYNAAIGLDPNTIDEQKVNLYLSGVAP